MIGLRPAAEASGVIAGITATAAAGEPTSVLGIAIAVLLAAYAGALFGLAYTSPDTWGRLLSIPDGKPVVRLGWVLLRTGGLLTTVTVIAFVSAWSVSVLPHVPMLTWLAKIPQVPLAGLFAFGGQRLIPRALGAAERWLDRRAAS